MLLRERSKQPEPDCAVTFLACVCFHTCIKNCGPFSPWILIPHKLWSQLFAYFRALLVLTESTWVLLLLLLLPPQCSQRGKNRWCLRSKTCFFNFFFFFSDLSNPPVGSVGLGQWTGGVMVGVILKDILETVSRRHLQTKGCQCPTCLSRKSTLGCLISKIQQWAELFIYF